MPLRNNRDAESTRCCQNSTSTRRANVSRWPGANGGCDFAPPDNFLSDLIRVLLIRVQKRVARDPVSTRINSTRIRAQQKPPGSMIQVAVPPSGFVLFAAFCWKFLLNRRPRRARRNAERGLARDALLGLIPRSTNCPCDSLKYLRRSQASGPNRAAVVRRQRWS